MIKFYCGNCEKKIGVPYEYAGKKVRCPRCKEGVAVPQPEPDTHPEPAAMVIPADPEPQIEDSAPDSIWPDDMFDTEPTKNADSD